MVNIDLFNVEEVAKAVAAIVKLHETSEISAAQTKKLNQVLLAAVGKPPSSDPDLPGGAATIAQQAQVTGKEKAGHGTGVPEKVATAKGEAHFHQPIGALIIPHLQYAKGEPEHAIPNVSEQKWIAGQWGSKEAAAEAAKDAVAKGTHHWVHVGSKVYAVRNGLGVHVPKNTDAGDEAAVKNAPKVVVKHGPEPEHVTLHPQGGFQPFPHKATEAGEVAQNWKKLPDQEAKKSVTINGQHAAWVPSHWKVYKAAGHGDTEENLIGKWALDDEHKWHFIGKGGEEVPKSHNADAWVKNGSLVSDEEHGAPEPEHVAPSQGKTGAEPTKHDIGGVAVTKDEIQDAIQKLQGSASTQIKGLLKGHPLEASDYHQVFKDELAKFPELNVSSGTKQKHASPAKGAFIHALAGALDQIAKTEAEQDAAQAAKDQAEQQAAHAQELTPHEHTMGQVSVQAGPSGTTGAAAKTAVTKDLLGKPASTVMIPAAPGSPGTHFGASEQEIKDAITVLQANKSTAVKQPLQKAGNALWQMDYHKINADELAAHPELKVQAGTKQAHVGQVKTSVLHYLQGLLDGFKTGGVQASKDDVQQAIDVIEASPYIGPTQLKLALHKVGSKFGDMDFGAVVHQYKKEHPNTTAGMSTKEVVLAWLKSHHGDMAKADTETGHDQAAELHALVTSGTPKKGWNLSADGALAAALVAAGTGGKHVQYAHLGSEPGVWTVSMVPPGDKAALKATPDHKVYLHFADQSLSSPWMPEHVLEVAKEWIKPGTGEEKTETPPSLAEALKPHLPEKPPPPTESKAPVGYHTTPAPADWKKEPGWEDIHGLVISAQGSDVPKISAASTTDDWLARALWVTYHVGVDKYLVTDEKGAWAVKSLPPAAGTWGAQTAAGFYHITPDHQVTHTDKEGIQTAYPASQVLEVAQKLKKAPPAQPAAAASAISGIDVKVKGNVVGNVPHGSLLYHGKNATADTANYIFAKLPDGTWKRFGKDGEAPPHTPVDAINAWVDGGVLVPAVYPGEAQQVTIPGTGLKFQVPPGTTFWHAAGMSPADIAGVKLFMKYPDGTWHVIWAGMKEPKVAASGISTLNGFVASGSFIPYNGAAKTLAKAAETPDVKEPAPQAPALPPEATEVPHDIKTAVGSKVFGNGTAPAGSQVYWYSAGADSPEEVSTLYVKLPDDTWKVYLEHGEVQSGIAVGYDSYVSSGAFTALGAIKAAPVPPKPAGEEMTVTAGGKEWKVPAGSTVYAEAKAKETKTVYVLEPDGTAYYMGAVSKTSVAPAYIEKLLAAGTLGPYVPPPETPAAAEGVPVTVLFKGQVVGTVPAGSKLYQYVNTKTYGDSIFAHLPDGTWQSAGAGGVSALSKYSVPAADKIKEVAPASAADIAHAQEIGKLKDLFAKGAVVPGDAQKSWLAYAAVQYTIKSGYHAPSQVTVATNATGTFYAPSYLPSTGIEYWKIDELFNVTHQLSDGTTEQVLFGQVKAGLEQYVHPDSVLLDGKVYKHGLYYNPKGKAYLEISPGNKNAYSAHQKANYTWHKADGGTEGGKSHYFAIKQLEKNTEWHPPGQPKDLGPAKLGKAVKYVTAAEPGTYGMWSEQDGAGGTATVQLKPDGSALVTYGDGSMSTWFEEHVAAMLTGGGILDKYGTTVVKPGIQPSAYHVWGSPARTKAELEALRDHLQQATEPGTGWQPPVFEFLGGLAGSKLFPPAAKPFAQKFFQEKGYSSGEDQRLKLIALLNELLLVPEQPAGSALTGGIEPKFLKGLPEGIHTPQQVFGWTDTGYAKPFSGGIDLEQLFAGQKPPVIDKIKAISAEFGGGKVVGTHPSSFNFADAHNWLKAWKAGDMQVIFALDAAGGKVSPVHPGAPDNTATHHISWAPWDPGQVPASKDIEGTWTPLEVTPSLAEVQNYLIKINVQHAAYLTAAEWRQLVKAHRQHDQGTVDKLSKLAFETFQNDTPPKSQPPKWTEDVKPAKSYDVYLEDGKAVQQWSQQAVQDYTDEHFSEIAPFAQQVAQEYGYEHYSAKEAMASWGKQAAQKYLDDVKKKEEAEKLRPKWELVPGDSSRVKDQFGHVMLWHTGTKKDLNRRVAVAQLARAWGFRIPLSEHAFLEADKTPGVITPQVQPDGTLAGLAHGTITGLTDRQLADIAREHLLDYALANHGSTPGSYLLMQDGSVIAASKEDAFGDLTWAGADLTGMNDWAKQPVSLILSAILGGKLSKDRADKLYVATIQAARRMALLSDGRLTAILKGTGLLESDVQGLLGRKNVLPADIQALWDSAFAKAGWTPPEVPEAKLSHGLHSGFSEPEFMNHVLGAKAFGVPAFFAGGDLTNGHVHVWTEFSAKGTRLLRGEMAARDEAIAKIMGWVKAHSGEETSKMVPKDDGQFHSAILNAAEGVKTHSDPGNSQYGYYGGPIMTDVFTAFNQAKADLATRLAAAEQAVNLGPSSGQYQSVASQYGDPGAVVSMAKQYLAQIETIETAKSLNQGLNFTPEQFPGWSPAHYESVTASGVKITYKKASRELGSNSNNLTEDSWQLGKDDGELHLKAGLSTQYQGYMWEVQFLGTGEVLDINDSADTQTPPGQQGRIRFTANMADGSASLERIRAFLQEAGLGMDEATQPEMERLYWRLAAATLADRADGSGHNKSAQAKQVWQGVGQHGGVNLKEAKYVGQIPGLLAAKGLTAEEENAVWRQAFTAYATEAQIGKFTEDHGYLPHLGHFDIRNPEMTGGKPEWYRFDLTPEQVSAKPFLVNHLHSAEKDAVLIARTGGLFSGEGRLRALGTYKPGMSWASDQQKGSGGTVFLRQNMQGSHSSYQVWVSPRVMARMQTYAFYSDQYGESALKRTYAHWDFDTATSHSDGSNEAMIADAVSFLDDVEVLRAYSAQQRQKIISDLHAAGITEIRGLKVEDRIVSSNSDVAAAITKAKAAAKKLLPSWFTQPGEQPVYTGATEAAAQSAEAGGPGEQSAEAAESGAAAEGIAVGKWVWTVTPSGNVWTMGDYQVVFDKSAGNWDVWYAGAYLGDYTYLHQAKIKAEEHAAQMGLASVTQGEYYTTVTASNTFVHNTGGSAMVNTDGFKISASKISGINFSGSGSDGNGNMYLPLPNPVTVPPKLEFTVELGGEYLEQLKEAIGHLLIIEDEGGSVPGKPDA